jgi:hypothetical protein
MKYFIFAFVLLVAGGCATVASNYDSPKYTVIASQDRFEVRDYAPYLAAEVTVTGEQRAALNDGFRILADYIFGNNVAMTAPVTSKPASEKVAMTVPVMQSASADAWTVRFMMPHDYTAQTLAKPNRPDIRIITVPGARKAVVRFSGFASDSNFAKREKELEAYITAQKLTVLGPPERAYYNPNEILVPVAAAP